MRVLQRVLPMTNRLTQGLRVCSLTFVKVLHCLSKTGHRLCGFCIAYHVRFHASPQKYSAKLHFKSCIYRKSPKFLLYKLKYSSGYLNTPFIFVARNSSDSKKFRDHSSIIWKRSFHDVTAYAEVIVIIKYDAQADKVLNFLGLFSVPYLPRKSFAAIDSTDLTLEKYENTNHRM